MQLNAENQKLTAENQQLKECATTVHRVNHTYRDVLSQVFGLTTLQTDSTESMEEIEQRTLHAVS